MTTLSRDQGVLPQEAAPLLPVEALARGVAILQGRHAPVSMDWVDAAYLTVDLRAVGWTVVATPRRGGQSERVSALGACLAKLAGLAAPQPRHLADGEALLLHLHSGCFDLVPCEPGDQ